MNAGAKPPSAPAPREEPTPVTVLLVTHNNAPDLAACFQAIAAQEHRPLDAVVVDCASSDGSADAAREAAATHGVPTAVFPLAENRGFAGGMNEALTHTDAPYVLSLNADARPDSEYLSTLLARLAQRPLAAAATGRLTRLDPATGVPTLDACGMRLTLTWRHLDRGSGEPDRGQYPQPEQVFGATGAASLLRRQALDDVAIEGEIFDEAFHSFREDAELAFRLQERGWQVLYEPAAKCQHRRQSLPTTRRQMPHYVNYHSLKNRYLLRAYHQTPSNLLLTAIPTLARDLAALAYVLLQERTSLRAYQWLWQNRHQILRHRKQIQTRRTTPPHHLNQWFRQDHQPL